MKRPTRSRMTDFFEAQKKLCGDGNSVKKDMGNPDAEHWASQFSKHGHPRPIYLTPDQRSWILHVERWWPPPDATAFETEWKAHPAEYHALQLYGKTVRENRWSQMWGRPYSYSGATNTARPITEAGTMLQELIQTVNEMQQPPSLTKLNHPTTTTSESSTCAGESVVVTYNAVLQNWYEPTHTIGLHADDERGHVPEAPIFSLSWGGTRRFVLRSKSDGKVSTELYLGSGDLLVMGGTCQQTHKHTVPGVRKTKDPPTSNRINWTVRAFRES